MGEALNQLDDELSSILGVTPDELKEEMKSGKTLSQIAQEKGVDPQLLIDTIVNQMKTDLSDKVSSGKITQDQADKFLQDIQDKAKNMVENGPKAGGCKNGRGPRDDETQNGQQNSNTQESGLSNPGGSSSNPVI